MTEVIRKIERPKPVTELVIDRLRADIIENRFKLGEKISETQLAELYGVTKAPVRAAYIRLEAEGLLRVRPQSGTFVFRPTADELRALYADSGINGAAETITYCRIGERSSHTWFVLTELLGYRDVKNYDGSWTEYGSLVDVPVELGS